MANFLAGILNTIDQKIHAGRARREAFILGKLSDGAWWFALDLVEQSDGLLGRGTVYITLARLEDLGEIEGARATELHPDRIPRRMYRKVQVPSTIL